MVSHPVWVRGLKHGMRRYPYVEKGESHPVWVRGLKPAKRAKDSQVPEVAPRVGAWIET